MRPRRLAGVGARPLNFTVRRLTVGSTIAANIFAYSGTVLLARVLGGAVVLGTAVCSTAVAQTEPYAGSFVCPVTVVNGGKGGTYGNDVLEVELWPQDFVFKPGGPGFVDSDGALGMKVGWKRKKRGHLEVGGRRLDGEAKPVRAYFGDAGEIGGQPTYLVFPTPGCWQVTGYVGDGSLTFVVSVEKIGEGPSWRFNGPPAGMRVSMKVAPPVEEPLFGEWNRLNTRQAGGNPSNSEHEVMRFWVEAEAWSGRYEKHPEPTLGFPNPPDGTFGIFTGAVATNFVCQPTFPFYPCQDVVQVIEGTTRYSPAGRPPFDIHQQHIVVRERNGHEVMWQYFVSPGNFACPWYRDFEEALAATRLTAHGDCIFQVRPQ